MVPQDVFHGQFVVPAPAGEVDRPHQVPFGIQVRHAASVVHIYEGQTFSVGPYAYDVADPRLLRPEIVELCLGAGIHVAVAYRAQPYAAVGTEGAGKAAFRTSVCHLLGVPHGGVAYGAVFGGLAPSLDPFCATTETFVLDRLLVPSGGFARGASEWFFGPGGPLVSAAAALVHHSVRLVSPII